MDTTVRLQLDEAEFNGFVSVARTLKGVGDDEVEMSLPDDDIEVVVRKKRPQTRFLDSLKLIGDDVTGN